MNSVYWYGLFLCGISACIVSDTLGSARQYRWTAAAMCLYVAVWSLLYSVLRMIKDGK
jgi:hypothetical protein